MYFNHHLCLFHQNAATPNDVFQAMAARLQEQGCVKDSFLEAVENREKEYPTGILFENTGFAIPHTDSAHVNESQICFASLKKPVPFASMIDKSESVDVELVFMLAMSQPHEQVETLQNLMALFQDGKAVEKLKACNTQEEFAAILHSRNIS
ncbi:PTS sugar transporter subunit IIA [Faecalibaculum rodentium]|jgi:PTS system galactitol-specific IIA component|uniref:PTS sugar transporter subunit IIA n=1 Tax=Faecalibaculum rodentium TaxID=1702221 RepID=UPI002491C546|nr:PTS sugar transporter subunit IIA [Faecalibaculum rodentium]